MVHLGTGAPLKAEALPPSGDPVLCDYLSADAAGVEQHLDWLVAEHVTPLIHQIVLRRLFGRGAFRHTTEEVEDAEAQATMDVLVRLRDLREGFNPEPIASLSSYVAVVAYNACHRSIRSRRPNRARLKNRLRYLFSHDPDLALWQDAAGEWICGRAARRGRPVTSDARARFRALAGDPFAIGCATPDGRDPGEPDVARAVVAHVDGGVELNDLTGLVAERLGLNDTEAGHDPDGSGLVDRLQAPEPSVLTALTDRADLQHLWREVLELPVRQRVALLLNLRDQDAGGMLSLFPMTGTASIRDIAAALDMPALELARLWNELPIEDARIAERLGLSRQQVINLRKSARERLARRMAG
jgi:RNA polymerase sigma factor (sigma-70 family)